MTAHPIERVKARRFAAFSDVDISFAPQVNVIVGDNGAGKSQLLKLLYVATSVLSDPGPLAGDRPSRAALQPDIADKLVGVFRPEALGRLTNRRQGRTRAEVEVSYGNLRPPLKYSFASNSRSEVRVASAPENWIEETPAFLPTRELLSIFPGLASLYDERAVEFDETWRDTALLLGRPVRRGPREPRAAEILEPLEAALGGIVVEDHGRFYLQQQGIGNLEMHLVAEGLRKLGTLARLVASGTLLGSGYLFWDEPETNLNPRSLKEVATTIVALSRAGVQTFVATHSLFLLRELEILLSYAADKDNAVGARFIGLHRDEGGVTQQSGDEASDMGDITALDAELAQSDRYFRLTS